jgi:hypothetical protein
MVQARRPGSGASLANARERRHGFLLCRKGAPPWQKATEYGSDIRAGKHEAPDTDVDGQQQQRQEKQRSLERGRGHGRREIVGEGSGGVRQHGAATRRGDGAQCRYIVADIAVIRGIGDNHAARYCLLDGRLAGSA